MTQQLFGIDVELDHLTPDQRERLESRERTEQHFQEVEARTNTVMLRAGFDARERRRRGGSSKRERK